MELEMSNAVRVRFAPSPTGYLHVGGARSALFNYLFARHHTGTFILRIEDTDRNRFVEGALEEIYTSLKWLGINWDEGPDAGGDFGPYIQSERIDIYQKHTQQLIDSKNAYRCFCSPQRLTEIRGIQEKNKEKIGYDRHCRQLSPEESWKRSTAGEPYVIRFRIPDGETVSFKDAVRGVIEYQSDIMDDFVLLKTDGFPTYHLASVVDDHLMAISHVLRGDEWIASTPKHLLLYEAFGWSVPEFAHLPVILSSSGGKLSKRKGAASVMDYKKEGYLPEALSNFLALLGWAPGGDREKMSAKELISAFSMDLVSPKSSVFDEKKLEWMNGLYMTERSTESLSEEVKPLLSEKGIPFEEENENYLEKAVELLKTRSKKIPDLVAGLHYFYTDPESYDEKADRKNFVPDALERLTLLKNAFNETEVFKGEELEKMYRKAAETTGIPIGKFIHPTRLAVSGVSFGPGLYELLETLGKERVIRRIDKAVKYIEDKNS